MEKPGFFRKLRADLDWQLNPRFVSMRRPVESRNFRDIKRFGKLFITTFPRTIVKGRKRSQFVICASYFKRWESPVSITLAVEPVDKKGEQFRGMGTVGTLMLSFEKDAVIIRPQGVILKQSYLERFREVNEQKMPWANFMAQLVERHAQKCGFEYVKIPTPETLAYFDKSAGTKQRIKRLYEGIASSMGYKREGNFFVKNLRLH